MANNVVNSMELREKMGDILNRVQYRNETIVIVRRGRQVAQLTPINQVVSDPTAQLLANAAPPEEPEEKSSEKPRKNPKKR